MTAPQQSLDKPLWWVTANRNIRKFNVSSSKRFLFSAMASHRIMHFDFTELRNIRSCWKMCISSSYRTCKKLWNWLFVLICLRVLNRSQRCLYHEDVPLIRTYFKTITFNTRIQGVLKWLHRYTHVRGKHDFINKHPPSYTERYGEQKLFKIFPPDMFSKIFTSLKYWSLSSVSVECKSEWEGKKCLCSRR